MPWFGFSFHELGYFYDMSTEDVIRLIHSISCVYRYINERNALVDIGVHKGTIVQYNRSSMVVEMDVPCRRRMFFVLTPNGAGGFHATVEVGCHTVLGKIWRYGDHLCLLYWCLNTDLLRLLKTFLPQE